MRRDLLPLLLCFSFACASGKPAPQPPAAPTGVSARAGDGQVTLLWNSVDGALSYRVYDGIQGGSLGAPSDVGSVTSWTVVGLANGSTYQFAVSAVGVGGESALSAIVTATPKAKVSLAVTSTAPADGAASVPRNSTIVVTFNEAVDPASVTAGCAGSLQVSDDNFATCVAAAVSVNGTQATLTPSAPLDPGATYLIRATTSVLDTNELPLASTFTSQGFTTAAALTASIAPVTSPASLSPAIVVSFNRAIDQGTLSAATCLFATAGNCLALNVSLNGTVATFTPAAPLTPSTQYSFDLTTAVNDSDGLPLTAGAAIQFTTVGAAAVIATGLQHISLAWSAAHGVHVYLARSGSAFPGSPASTFSGSTGTMGPLTPGKTWDVRVVPLDAGGVETADHTDLPGIVCALTGTPSDFTATQVATSTQGGSFYATWSDTELFIAFANADGTTLQAAPSDALWLAVQTGAANGEWQTQTGLNGTITWPFQASYVVELKTSGQNLRTVPAWAPLTNGTADIGAHLAELRFPLSDLGSPAHVKLAFAAVATHANDAADAYVFDSAPGGVAGHINTIAQAATLTDGYAVDLSQAMNGFGTPVAASDLVTFTVSGATTPQLKGSISPLSYSSPIALPGGSGSFNLGAITGELFFKLSDGGTDELTPGSDRVWTLSGGADSLPALTYGIAYSATHSFSLTFVVDSGGVPESVRGSVSELGNWGVDGDGALVTQTAPYTTGPVTFTSHDFTAAPLAFKAWYGNGNYEAGSDNSMNDDVINSRVLTWTAGSEQNF